jgi:hypothetical protein
MAGWSRLWPFGPKRSEEQFDLLYEELLGKQARLKTLFQQQSRAGSDAEKAAIGYRVEVVLVELEQVEKRMQITAVTAKQQALVEGVRRQVKTARSGKLTESDLMQTAVEAEQVQDEMLGRAEAAKELEDINLVPEAAKPETTQSQPVKRSTETTIAQREQMQRYGVKQADDEPPAKDAEAQPESN